MAGYFSNLSQSRFLANSSSTTHTTSSNSSTNGSSPHNQNNGSAASSLSRPRISTSKHFSTSVQNTSGDERSSGKDKFGVGSLKTNNPSNNITVHPLRNTWVFWFRQHRAPGNKITNYEEGIKKISTFSSVESFWSLWSHLNPPSRLQPTTDYLLFHSGIKRPVWEDPLNLSGGKWIIRLKKGVADRLWEDIVLAVVGDQFDDCGNVSTDEGEGTKTDSGGQISSILSSEPEICGCTISVRQSEDILSVWNREGTNTKVTNKIRNTIRRVLNLSPTTIMEYKTNNDSMQDKSSFRNSSIDRSLPT